MENIDIQAVKDYLQQLQQQLCTAIETEDGAAKFKIDDWHNASTVTASTRIISQGKVFEHGATNFSHVIGKNLPATATEQYPHIAGAAFEAMGVSLIMHPQNPYVPTTHFNLRLFYAKAIDGSKVWWFGGGYDLTPYYGFEVDCLHWHETAQAACMPFGTNVYAQYKRCADEYFYLPHRNETRGIGGLFFNDLNCWNFEKCFAFIQSIGNSFLPAYLPIVQRRKHLAYTAREKDFQLYRRGRYVEFNLLYDRGTMFGLQSKGRTESILASLPPQVTWRYNWQPEPGSAEAKLYSDFLRPREWLTAPLAV